jgi:hypothetical protein
MITHRNPLDLLPFHLQMVAYHARDMTDLPDGVECHHCMADTVRSPADDDLAYALVSYHSWLEDFHLLSLVPLVCFPGRERSVHAQKDHDPERAANSVLFVRRLTGEEETHIDRLRKKKEAIIENYGHRI